MCEEDIEYDVEYQTDYIEHTIMYSEGRYFEVWVDTRNGQILKMVPLE